MPHASPVSRDEQPNGAPGMSWQPAWPMFCTPPHLPAYFLVDFSFCQPLRPAHDFASYPSQRIGERCLQLALLDLFVPCHRPSTWCPIKACALTCLGPGHLLIYCALSGYDHPFTCPNLHLHLGRFLSAGPVSVGRIPHCPWQPVAPIAVHGASTELAPSSQTPFFVLEFVVAATPQRERPLLQPATI